MAILLPFRCLRRNVACGLALLLALAPASAADRGGSLEREARRGDPQRVLTMPLEFARTTSGFATRRHPIRKTLHLHAGVDFAAAHGTTVRSVDEGEVEFAGTQGGYGKVVYIRHGGQRTTVYAHLSRIDVRAGEQVLQGKTIGAVGATGMATGPHLHFEVRERGKPIDPLLLAYASTAAPRVSVDVAATLIDPERCFELLQKASLESLEPGELEFLRGGCVQ